MGTVEDLQMVENRKITDYHLLWPQVTRSGTLAVLTKVFWNLDQITWYSL